VFAIFLRLDLNINHEMLFLGLHIFSVSIFLNFFFEMLRFFCLLRQAAFFSNFFVQDLRDEIGGMVGWDWMDRHKRIG